VRIRSARAPGLSQPPASPHFGRAAIQGPIPGSDPSGQLNRVQLIAGPVAFQAGDNFKAGAERRQADVPGELFLTLPRRNIAPGRCTPMVLSLRRRQTPGRPSARFPRGDALSRLLRQDLETRLATGLFEKTTQTQQGLVIRCTHRNVRTCDPVDPRSSALNGNPSPRDKAEGRSRGALVEDAAGIIMAVGARNPRPPFPSS
jgi:hypothetical protein